MYIGVVYAHPPEQKQDPIRDLTFDQVRRLTPDLKGLPICDDHRKEYNASKEFVLPEYHVGTITNAYFKAEDGNCYVEWHFANNAAGKLAQSKVDRGEYQDLSLSHEVNNRTGAIRPLEVSVCKEGARPGTYIINASGTMNQQCTTLGKILTPSTTMSETKAEVSSTTAPVEAMDTTPETTPSKETQEQLDLKVLEMLRKQYPDQFQPKPTTAGAVQEPPKQPEGGTVDSPAVLELKRQAEELKKENERLQAVAEAANQKSVNAALTKIARFAKEHGSNKKVEEKLDKLRELAKKDPAAALDMLETVAELVPTKRAKVDPAQDHLESLRQRMYNLNNQRQAPTATTEINASSGSNRSFTDKDCSLGINAMLKKVEQGGEKRCEELWKKYGVGKALPDNEPSRRLANTMF
jgi:hypothetical protein